MPHIVKKKRSIYNPTKNTERRLELEAINHKCAWRLQDEFVIMSHTFEGSGYHDVLKSKGTLKSSNSDSKFLLNSEMPSFPRHFVSQINQSVRYACNSPFMCFLG